MVKFFAKCMRHGRTPRALVAAALFCGVSGLAAQSQSNQKESLGEAARKARQQKKPAAKPVKVLTDDDLARRKATGPEQPTQAAAAPAQGEAAATETPGQTTESAPPEGPAPAAEEAGSEPEQRARAVEDDLKSAKQQLAEAEKELNLIQREFDLRRDQYYSNPEFKSDRQGKAQLDSLQQQITVRQQEVERLKGKIASLEAERKTLPAPPPSTPPAQEKPATPPQP